MQSVTLLGLAWFRLCLKPKQKKQEFFLQILPNSWIAQFHFKVTTLRLLDLLPGAV